MIPALVLPKTEEPSAPVAPARPRVLVVDDELALARSIARVLGSAGYDVTAIGDGASAVEEMKRGEFDVILSDIQMPEMTGVDLLRMVRDHDLDVPVILMTADPRIETATQAVELGALQYLVKPVTSEVLVKAIERAARLHRMARMKREAMKLLGTLEVQAGDRAGLMASFDRALETMWMAYQPIVGSNDQQVFGYEALMRSNEPTLPHPGAILNAAERLDRLPDLGRRVRSLSADGFAGAAGDALLFVNLHARDLLDPRLADPNGPLTKAAGRVVMEITERAALDEVHDIRVRIAALREMGYRIAIDDLGAGYAGLTSFAMLEPEFVKLDMTLVRGVHTSAIKQKLIGSMTSLCKDMGMQVVAEGIETTEERDVVIALGCDLLQGYLFARPGRPFPTPVWG